MAKLKGKISFITVVLPVFALAMLLFFSTLDLKIFDIFLRVLPSLTENEKVIVLTLDDDSMELAGGFPFRREAMADIIVLLKELGVETIAFDLSYLDESAKRFDSNYAEDILYRFLGSGIDRLNDTTIMQIAPELGWDVDEYFAQAIAFTDNSWLTLTFIPPENILNIEEFVTDAEIDRYLANYIAPQYIKNNGDTLTPEMPGVMPAIQKLLSRAKSAGSVNAVIDKDGLRRRVHFLFKYQDNYYPQLAFGAIKEKMGYESIEVSNKTIDLKMKDGSTLSIPRMRDGSVLLKWPKKSFFDYLYISLYDLILYTITEAELVDNISLMADMGFFYVWDREETPLDYYYLADSIKKEAFANNSAVPAEWFAERKAFLQSSSVLLNGPYEGYIIEDFADDPDTAEYVRMVFEVTRERLNWMFDFRENMSILNNSFCVIGSTATSVIDIGTNTFEESYPNVGSYAVVANMLLSGEFLDDSPWYISALIALLASLLLGFLLTKFDTYRALITGLGGIVLLTGAFVVFFAVTKVYVGFAVPLVSTVVTFLSIMIYKFLTASREKAFLHNAFSRYLAPEVIKDIINDPDKLNLGGEKREMTAIFTDIQGFSTISEQLDPSKLVMLLNRYLTVMSNIIMDNKGTIDKYEGDAIIAFFGAPLLQPEHPSLACRSAIAMKEAEKELNKTVVEEGLSPVPLFTRIGINTGDMVVGNMGAENKMDYTIMGNAVNLAARLEGVNKAYRTGGILISEYTKEKIGDDFLVRRLDRVRVVGINTPLRLYELLGFKETASKQELDAAGRWEQALDLFEKRQFEKALKIYASLCKSNPNDNVAQLYHTRCEAFIKKPPAADWDAVRNLTEK